MTLDPIDAFIKRVKGAAAGRSKDVRLTIDEAQALVACLGELLAEHVVLKTNQPEETIKITVSGGKI